MNFYDKSVQETLKILETSEEGLTSKEANKRLEKYGANELPRPAEESIFHLFISQFENPIELILVMTVVFSFIAKEYIDAIALIFIILIDVIMGTYEEWKARKDAESLTNLIKVTARVIRNGKEIEIPSKDLTLGDLMLLESGDKISADDRIIDSHNFQVMNLHLRARV